MARDYNFQEIERKWHQKWNELHTYKVTEDEEKKKFYVLNMFPYPSGAGLHVGHPLGYIASDIYARYKRLQGFNVLNPMGYDAYGLPAEQHAIKTGQHPEISTFQNIDHYREQLDKIGFSSQLFHSSAVNCISSVQATSQPAVPSFSKWATSASMGLAFCSLLQKKLPNIFWKAHCVQW